MSEFNLSTVDALDQAQLDIRHPKSKAPTGWIWTFYGPAHPKTVALADRVTRSTLVKLAAQRQARVNGREWLDDAEQTPGQLRAENVDNILERTAGFTPVNLGEGKIEFSAEAARGLLLDRKKGWLLSQVMTFLSDEASFIQPSATA